MKPTLLAASVLLGIAVLSSFSDSSFAQQAATTWWQFRGPQGRGHAQASNLPVEFSLEKNLVWQAELPGRGWSSPVVVGDFVWLTTALETKSVNGRNPIEKVRLQAIAIARESGTIQYVIDLFEVPNPPSINSLNSFASPTPVANESHIYFHFGAFGTACCDVKNGELIWKNLDHVIDHEQGPGSSPILLNNQLIFHCDGCDQQYVVALDAESGKLNWRSDRSGKMSENPMYQKAFSTPVVVRRGKIDLLVSAAANWVYGYDAKSGNELWKINYGILGFSNVAMPIVHDETMYICSGYMRPKMLAIDLAESSALDQSSIKWTYHRQVPNMPSPILVDGFIYFVSDNGIVTCLDAETGKAKWTDRLPGEYSASPILADNKLFFCNRDGEVSVLRPNQDELERLAVNRLESGIMATPAVVDQSLFIRTKNSLLHFQRK